MKNRAYLGILLILPFIVSCGGNKYSALSSRFSYSDVSFITSYPKTFPDLADINSTTLSDAYIKNGYTPLYEDSNFKSTVQVTTPDYGTYGFAYYDERIKLHEGYNENSLWRICQWHTKNNLHSDTKPYYQTKKSLNNLQTEIISPGKIIDRELVPAKRIVLNSYTGSIYLEANTEVEYEHSRKDGENWPHLLMEQSFVVNDSYKLTKVNSLIADMFYTVDFCECKMPNGEYDKNKHAAEFIWYFSIQNLDWETEGFGAYYWLGIRLFDSRTANTINEPYINFDEGTKTLIYTPSSDEYEVKTNGRIPKVGEEAEAKIDILPYAKEGFKKASEKGYLRNANFENMYVSGFNFGFEIPGTFNIGASIKGVNLFSK